MNDHPVQLCFVSGTELFSIGAYGVETDEKITGNPIAFTIVERNDIRVIIVLQILAVYFQNLFVRAKDISYFTDLLSVSFSYGFYPGRSLTLLDGGHIHAFRLISNHNCLYI